MLNIFSSNNKSIIDAKTLQQLLNEILTPRLHQIGLTKATKYGWHEQTTQEIRRGFSYIQLKGAIGTFTWGVNVDFLPVVRGNKVEYYKTPKKYMHHLFEWADEYANSFVGGQLQGGVTTHWGFKESKKSIGGLFDKYEKKIIKWFDRASTIENLTNIAEQQITTGKHYDIHFPRPKYVLPFFYAKDLQLDKAIQAFDALDLHNFDNNDDLKKELRTKLLTLAKKNGM
jgi:hypothetical protein